MQNRYASSSDEGTPLSAAIFTREDLERITRTEGTVDGVKRVQEIIVTLVRIFSVTALAAAGIVITLGLFIYDLSHKELTAMKSQTETIKEETQALGRRMVGVESNVEEMLKRLPAPQPKTK